MRLKTKGRPPKQPPIRTCVYWTITWTEAVRVMAPEVAVTVSVCVPAGVPLGLVIVVRPQPANVSITTSAMQPDSATRYAFSRRREKQPSSAAIEMLPNVRLIPRDTPEGLLFAADSPSFASVRAVVVTVTGIVTVPPAATVVDAGFGTQVSPAAVPAQVKFTVPANPPSEVSVSWKTACVPLSRVTLGAVEPKLKSPPEPVSAITVGLVAALLTIVMVPAAVPETAGVKPMVNVQVAPIATLVPQLLVCV